MLEHYQRSISTTDQGQCLETDGIDIAIDIVRVCVLLFKSELQYSTSSFMLAHKSRGKWRHKTNITGKLKPNTFHEALCKTEIDSEGFTRGVPKKPKYGHSPSNPYTQQLFKHSFSDLRNNNYIGFRRDKIPQYALSDIGWHRRGQKIKVALKFNSQIMAKVRTMVFMGEKEITEV